MAKVVVKPKEIIDPNSPEAIETKRIEDDMKKATVDSAETKDRRDNQSRFDAERIAAEKKEAEHKAAEIKIKQDDARAAELKKPLTESEQQEYRNILAQCRSGKQVDPTSMKILGDFRIRLKNNGVANPE